MWHDPNVENCSTVEITKIKEQVNNFRAIVEANQNPINSNRTLTVKPEDLQIITDELVTNTDENILPNDLKNVISTVEDIIRWFLYTYSIALIYVRMYIVSLYNWQGCQGTTLPCLSTLTDNGAYKIVHS